MGVKPIRASRDTVVMMTLNDPRVITKRKNIEGLLRTLPKIKDPVLAGTTIRIIQQQMHELKRMNRMMERKHVGAVISRIMEIKNTQLKR